MAKDSFRQAVAFQVVQLLRKEREKQKLSMNVLAERSGLSQSMISLTERDLRNPTLDTLLRISEVLGIELGDIIKKATAMALKNPRESSKN